MSFTLFNRQNKSALTDTNESVKLKLLLITQGFSRKGGANVYAYELAKSLSANGVEVHVMCPGDRTKSEYVAPNIIVHWHRAIHLPLLFVPMHHLRVGLRSKALIKRYSITSIHSNNFAGAFAHKGMPMLTTIHHTAKDEVKQHTSTIQRLIYSADLYFEKVVIKKSSAIIVDSHLIKGSLEKDGVKKPILVLPCGVDLEFFSKKPAAPMRKKLGIKHNELLLFFPGGSRSKRKGAIDLFQALQKSDWPPYKCVISGDPRADIGWAQEFNAGLIKSNLKDKVVNVGEISFNDLPQYYSAADIVVYPSTLEGFGLPALEALACNRPFIGTRTGEMPYIVKDGFNGLLIDTDSPLQLRSALKSLMESEVMRKTLAQNARKSVMEYSWESLAQALVSSHRQLMQEQSQ